MKVKLLRNHESPLADARIGDVIELPDAYAQVQISAGNCESTDEPVTPGVMREPTEDKGRRKVSMKP